MMDQIEITGIGERAKRTKIRYQKFHVHTVELSLIQGKDFIVKCVILVKIILCGAFFPTLVTRKYFMC